MGRGWVLRLAEEEKPVNCIRQKPPAVGRCQISFVCQGHCRKTAAESVEVGLKSGKPLALCARHAAFVRSTLKIKG